MCSLNWVEFATHIGIAFNRDESVKRSKAHPPKLFQGEHADYLMPKDPDGQGSWIAANNHGFVVMLLNDYQGKLKPVTDDLISRGLLVKEVAQCRSWSQITQLLSTWPLDSSQPFQLAVLTLDSKQFWHYDGIKTELSPQPLPRGVYSSGHPEVVDIIAGRQRYMSEQNIRCDDDLIAIHRSHYPQNDKPIDAQDKHAHAFCMHRPEACTQSLSYIKLGRDEVEFEYWPGQPCQTDQTIKQTLPLVVAGGL